jgi:hypothetical protein
MKSSEEWRAIPGHPGYEVSDLGRVRSLDRLIYDPRSETTNRPAFRRYPGRVLTPVLNTGYMRVKLGGGHPGVPIHRLLALAFIGPCPPGEEVCHNDGDKLNTRRNNIRYGTRSDNALDRVKHGRQASNLPHLRELLPCQ